MNFYPELARRCDANLGCTLDFGRSAMISMAARFEFFSDALF